MALTEDGIDMNEWVVRPNAPVVNARRMAQGDLEEVETERGGREVRVTDRTLLSALIAAGALMEYHREYAMTFLEWREAFFSGLGYAKPRCEGGDGSAARKYDEVSREIRPHRVRAVLFACLCESQSVRGDYREPFDRLAEAMDAARRREKDERRKCLPEGESRANVGT